MARLYLNPAARIPNEISISGKSLVPESGSAVVDPTAAFQQDFYEQAVAAKASDGSQVAAYTTAFNQLAAMLDAGPGWMLAPQTVTDPLINQGMFPGYSNGELKNGAALSATELATGVKSAALDGVNDYVETGWATRTNLAPTPKLKEAALGKWDGVGSFFINPATVTPELITSPFGGLDWCWKTVTPGTNPVEGCRSQPVNVVKNVTCRFSIYLRGVAGGEKVRLSIGSSTVGSATAEKTLGPAGVFQRFDISFTPTETGIAQIAVSTPTGVTKAISFYAGWALVEATSELTEYFPLATDLESGHVGWAGTAYESESDRGPFARGTVRTFVGIAKRTSSTGEDALIGTSGSSGQPSLQLASGSQNVDWNVTSSGQVSWAAAWPGNNVTAFYALIFNDAANTASLYINGALVSTQAQATTFTAPGTLRLGHRNAGTAPFEGSELPFAVYPRGLSGAEILSIYSGP